MAKPENISVLAVDDDDAVRESLGDYLDDAGFQVGLAISGEQAISMAQTTRFDVAIIDLRLPGISGDALMPRLRETNPDLRFLIHTGSLGFRISEELARLGIEPEHVLNKPQTNLAVFIESIMTLAGPNGNAG